MIERYSRKELLDIWSDKSKFDAWLLVEIYALEAYAKINKDITPKNIKDIWENAKVDIDRIYEIEKETRHDVIAFTRQISETLGDEKKWIHYGLTSTDVVDTAQSIRLKQVNKVLIEDIELIIKTIKKMAIKYKHTYQIGRTHGVHAEVTTFGYKLALWYDEMTRNLVRFKRAAKGIEVAKISGAVGNYANIPLSIQDHVADKLGLTSSKISTQTLQRDRHAEYIFTISLIGSSLDKFSTEIRHLQRTEVREVEEGFAKKQKGSSAMPHKKNPISSENISGLSRILRGFVTPAMEDIALWHERDISHSSVERIMLPDATCLIDYMMARFNRVLENLQVNEEKMLSNIWMTNGVIFSQRVMLEAISQHGWSREKAYDTVQPLAIKAFNENISFRDILIEQGIFNKEQVDKIFDLSYYSQNIDEVFQRLDINE